MSTPIKALSVCAALALPAASWAENPRPTVAYFLPQTFFNAQGTQTLTACAKSPGALPAVDTDWDLSAGSEPDPALLVKVDIGRGFLVERATSMVLRPDGTLEAFNATSSGQGGAVIQSVLKFAVAAAPLLGMDVGPRPTQNVAEPRYRCTDAARAALAEAERIGIRIAGLEEQAATGGTSAPASELIALLRARRASIRASLSRAIRPTTLVPTAAEAAAGSSVGVDQGPSRIAWFERDASGFLLSQVPGATGLSIRLEPSDGAMLNAVAAGDGTVNRGSLASARPRLVYRRPVIATLSAGWCAAPDCRDFTNQASVKAPVGQWSGFYSLSVGRGGLFGHRETRAKFDPYGTPLELSYGSSPGGADVAGVVDAAGGFASAVKDAEINGLERQIRLEEARRKLTALRDAD